MVANGNDGLWDEALHCGSMRIFVRVCQLAFDLFILLSGGGGDIFADLRLEIKALPNYSRMRSPTVVHSPPRYATHFCCSATHS